MGASLADDDEPPPPGPSVVVSDERAAPDIEVDARVLSDLLARVLAAEGVPTTAEASLGLVDPDDIAQLKAAHLDGDGTPTDVLSFPVDGAAPDAELVGDVVLCPRVAAEQADGHAGSTDAELALLVVHAGLHLVGWDHDDDDARRRMWERERELLSTLWGDPPRDPWAGAVPGPVSPQGSTHAVAAPPDAAVGRGGGAP